MVTAASRPKSASLTPGQRKHLSARIERAERDRIQEIYDERQAARDTAVVKAARAALAKARNIIEKFADYHDGVRERKLKALRKEAKACREAVLFSAPDAALRFVKQFEEWDT